MADVILFNIEDQRLAFDIQQIERIIWAVEVTPTPKSPKALLGIINMHGKILPVVNMRHLLGLPARSIKLTDQMLICKINENSVALPVDEVKGLSSYKEDQISPGSDVFPGMVDLDYVIKDQGEIILIYKWDRLIPVTKLEVPS